MVIKVEKDGVIVSEREVEVKDLTFMQELQLKDLFVSIAKGSSFVGAFKICQLVTGLPEKELAQWTDNERFALMNMIAEGKKK